ncbi:hypothetical protein [Paraclostridium bifermentans]|uniref:hypothetical protein n=1 Tax=Paraclostridium bifermentans TaxID=1490 RepID=UPI0018A8D446|nr:hypothetical protein [Paraclostridium bifermentans]
MKEKKLLKNTIRNSQYIIKKRLEKFIKNNKFELEGETDLYSIMDKQIDKNLEMIKDKLSEYEYDKSYKYFTLYNIHCGNINEKLLALKDYESIDEVYMDFYEGIDSETLTPLVKIYESLNEIDIKFSFIKKDMVSQNYIKYPVIATIFKDSKLISIKFSSVSELYMEDGFYKIINRLIIEWISKKLNLKLTEFNSIPVFRELDEEINKNEDKYPNISIYRVSRQDQNDGRSSFCSTRNDKLPLIDDIRRIVQTFENENDKEKILDFIKTYEEESTIRNIAFKWKNKFSNSKGKDGHIAVGINIIGSLGDVYDDVMLHHIYQQSGINRERINYVIKFISEYSRRN